MMSNLKRFMVEMPQKSVEGF